MEKKVKWTESGKGQNEWTKETRLTCTGKVPGCNPSTSSADWNLSKFFTHSPVSKSFLTIFILVFPSYSTLYNHYIW
jgi:hypothetical protein